MTKDIERLAFILLGTYGKLYESKYGKKAVVNKYKEKWAAASLIEDFGEDDVVETLNYYFKTSKDNHPLNWFYNNFDSLFSANKDYKRDIELRQQRRLETAKIRQEFLNGNA